MPDLHLTRHANIRASQRGIPYDLLDAMFTHADIEIHAGNGCTTLRCSRDWLSGREPRASIGPKADRLASLAVVVADDSGAIVTVLHDHCRSSGRRYRRP